MLTCWQCIFTLLDTPLQRTSPLTPSTATWCRLAANMAAFSITLCCTGTQSALDFCGPSAELACCCIIRWPTCSCQRVHHTDCRCRAGTTHRGMCRACPVHRTCLACRPLSSLWENKHNLTTKDCACLWNQVVVQVTGTAKLALCLSWCIPMFNLDTFGVLRDRASASPSLNLIFMQPGVCLLLLPFVVPTKHDSRGCTCRATAQHYAAPELSLSLSDRLCACLQRECGRAGLLGSDETSLSALAPGEGGEDRFCRTLGQRENSNAQLLKLHFAATALHKLASAGYPLTYCRCDVSYCTVSPS